MIARKSGLYQLKNNLYSLHFVFKRKIQPEFRTNARKCEHKKY